MPHHARFGTNCAGYLQCQVRSHFAAVQACIAGPDRSSDAETVEAPLTSLMPLCAAPPADFAPFPEWPDVPAEEDEASLFDRKLKPLRLGPGVYARGMQTLITGAEILTSVSGGARCAV